jgi:hypothetical protein
VQPHADFGAGTGAPGPVQDFNSRYCLGGLQSLAAATEELSPERVPGAEGPDALQVSIKAPMLVPDLEDSLGQIRKISFAERGNKRVLPSFAAECFDDSNDPENSTAAHNEKVQKRE